MADEEHLEKDLVCDMMVAEGENQYVYHDVAYAFCSQQCRERFIAAPRLYVRRRRLLEPAPKRLKVIKHNRIILGRPLEHTEFCALKDALQSMMGVLEVSPDGLMNEKPSDLTRYKDGNLMRVPIDALAITYDLLQATAEQLERKCVEFNASPRNDWGDKLLRNYIHYLERCDLQDLEVRIANMSGWETRSRGQTSEFQRVVIPRDYSRKRGVRDLTRQRRKPGGAPDRSQ